MGGMSIRQNPASTVEQTFRRNLAIDELLGRSDDTRRVNVQLHYILHQPTTSACLKVVV